MPATKEQVDQLEARMTRMERKLDKMMKLLECYQLEFGLLHAKIDYLGSCLLAPQEYKKLQKIA
ncbi:MAG TPA: hypothetical protein PKJ37_12500 [Acidobacteriota bacterium]|jgi:hypothetical protein|nr:hypothetical protein [Acidobacteriota bacterium]